MLWLGGKDTFEASVTLSKLSLEGEEDWMSHVAVTISFFTGTFLIFLLQLAAAGLYIYLVKQRDEHLVWPLVSFYLICILWLFLSFSFGILWAVLVSLKYFFLNSCYLVTSFIFQFWTVCTTGLINLEVIFKYIWSCIELLRHLSHDKEKLKRVCLSGICFAFGILLNFERHRKTWLLRRW